MSTSANVDSPFASNCISSASIVGYTAIHFALASIAKIMVRFLLLFKGFILKLVSSCN
jgi:hypothetical protein